MSTAAKFYDGVIASTHPVSVSLQDDALVFGNETFEQRWPYAEIVADAKPEKHGPLVLYQRQNKQAILMVEDGTMYRSLKPRLAKKNYPPIAITPSAGTLFGLGIAALMVLVILVTGLPRITASIARNLPDTWDEKLGAYAEESLFKGKVSCSQPDGLVALAKLRAAIQTKTNFTVRVVPMPHSNAIALPSGRIIVFAPLINAAQTPEELAGVIAHEIGHIEERHPEQALAHGIGLGTLSQIVLGEGGTGAGMSVALAVLKNSHSREMEAKADERAIEIMLESGISTAGMASFFERLLEKESNGGTIPFYYLSSHPASAERLQLFRSVNSPQTAPILTPEEWQALKNICAS